MLLRVVMKSLDGVLEINEGLTSSTDSGKMSVYKLRPEHLTTSWLSSLYDGAVSSITFTAVDAIFKNTDSILVQVEYFNNHLIIYKNSMSLHINTFMTY